MDREELLQIIDRAKRDNETQLDLSNKGITELPPEIVRLVNLETLGLEGNQLTSLPPEIGQLGNLQRLGLDGNPLNPALKSAYEAGLDELKAYLRSLAEPTEREELHEAKLILVGEGGVGKTTLLKALTGKKPKEGEKTTHGVEIDIQALTLAHPTKDGVELTLNAWDFGGQEVYRVTHQFFFSRRSIYLLVWEPRKGVQQCQVEDWLKMIRLRVGDDARVIVVSTHCRTGGRIARIDQPVFERDFGDLIAGFHEVDSLVHDDQTGDKVGVVELKEKIARAAADLEQMGMAFNRDWKDARDDLMSREEPRLKYEKFAKVCGQHGLDEISTKTLADLMHDLGYIVYYGDDEKLKDDVVLQPEWLTKAVSFVLEDQVTQEMDGILPDAQLKDVWLNHDREDQPRYGPELYPFFLGLMEKFDVSYRLEDGDASLIAQHVPQVRPDLPWLPDTEPKPGHRRLSLACVMDEEPPGLMPWMIVRTHPYCVVQHDANRQAHRLHWQKGVFLRKKTHGEALCEQRGREFHVHAEAVWPVFFMNVLRRTLTKLITDNWPGLEGHYYFAVPCPSKIDGQPCRGRFDVEALRDFLNQGIGEFPCQVCRKYYPIENLLFGFRPIDPAEQMVRIETGIARYTDDDMREVLGELRAIAEGQREGFSEQSKGFQELRTQAEHYFWSMLRAVATESRHGPRLFGLEPGDGNWRRLTKKRWRLVLWCEAEGCRHPMADEGQGVYDFEASREWVVRVAPYANLLARGLKFATALAAPMLKEFLGDQAFKNLDIAHKLDIMKTGTAHLLQKEFEPDRPPRLGEGPLTEPERDGVLALHSLLRDLDPHHAKLGLKRLPTYTGDYVWLCPTHYEQARSKIPDKFE